MQNNARHKFSEQANLYKAKPQMASGVFGTPITVETLQAIGLTAPTQKDVADYAMKMMNAGGKDTNAQNFVDNLKKKCGDAYSTECLIYNATGTTLYLDTYHDWHGHIYTSPYPPVIQNGQWGAYLHVCGFLVGSAGAVVYRSKVPSGGDLCDWLFSWSIPLIGDNGVNTCTRKSVRKVTSLSTGIISTITSWKNQVAALVISSTDIFPALRLVKELLLPHVQYSVFPTTNID
ncbi:unnamed protein product [Urochloa decumbens]|uniref:Uncharacterized protein n=1 Tax=Urochloa decumbens TaxID=240449 RepID=A0ABC9GFD4_9POAL